MISIVQDWQVTWEFYWEIQSPTFVCIPIAFQAANVYTHIIRTSSMPILIEVRNKIEKKENYISIRFSDL